ncbi:MAG: hypothetical protein HRT72_12680 [Flavobacteriales bacterium]|nr:hypothetical protein [Flavobacteriales bacterium]
MRNKKSIYLASVLLVFSLASCGVEYSAKKITADYCSCNQSANGLKEKAKCLTNATKEYTEALENVNADQLDNFKKGYKEGIKACK